MNGIITLKTWSGLFHHGVDPVRAAAATIEAKIISEMPLPMPRWVISSPNHISSTQPAVSVIDDHEDAAEREVLDDARCRRCENVRNRNT